MQMKRAFVKQLRVLWNLQLGMYVCMYDIIFGRTTFLQLQISAEDMDNNN